MLHKVALLVILGIWALMNTVFAEGITVTVATSAQVEGSYITLGQLADISGDDAQRINSLRQLKLGSAPSLGSSIVLTKEMLGMRLAGAGSDLSNIIWSIPDVVTVTANSQIIKGQVLIDKAVLTIQERIGNKKDISITSLGSVQDIAVPIGDVVITSDLPYGVHYNSPTAISVAVNVNGQAVSKMSLRFDVKMYQLVAVAASPISPGEIITTDKLRYERMDIGHLALGYFTDLNKVQGLMARRSLTPGMVISETILNKPLLIKRGSLVTILTRVGDMEVTAAGQAMQDGSEGQLIRVRNINSNRVISAKVLDASTVQVLSYQSKAY